MEKEKDTPILELIIKGLEEFQKIEIISRKIAKILFWLILAATLYLLGLFIYWVKIASSMDSNEFFHAYKLPLISLAVAASIRIIQNILKYIWKKWVQRFLIPDIRIMIEKKEAPGLLVSLGDKNPEDRVIRENSYDKRSLRILVFILILIKSKYMLEILDDLDLIYLYDLNSTDLRDILRRRLFSDIEALEDGQRNQYLQELSAFEEFFANLS